MEGSRRTVLDLAAELLERLRDSGLRELEVRHEGIRVKVSAEPSVPAPIESAPVAAPSRGVPERSAPASAAETKTVAAPLTGIFYRSGSPQTPPFVQPGTVVDVGDVIGLIEAMKLFNEVRSTIAGRVRRVVAENGQLVRAHQPLIELE